MNSNRHLSAYDSGLEGGAGLPGRHTSAACGVMLSRGSAGLLDKGFHSTQCPVLQSVFPQGKGFRELQVTHYWVAEDLEPGKNNHFIYMLVAGSPHLRWTQSDESLLIFSCVLCVTYNDQGWASQDSRWYWVIGWDFCR